MSTPRSPLYEAYIERSKPAHWYPPKWVGLAVLGVGQFLATWALDIPWPRSLGATLGVWLVALGVAVHFGRAMEEWRGPR